MSRSRAAAARGSMAGYIHAVSGYDEELARLRLLQERYDARTFGRLAALGSLAGAICLEVGAGAGLADAGGEAIACQRQGGGSAAEVLARSLERNRDQTLRYGAIDPGEFAAVLSALRDPSFSFVDALSVAAWGRSSRYAS